jgi:hypothetical protein
LFTFNYGGSAISGLLDEGTNKKHWAMWQRKESILSINGATLFGQLTILPTRRNHIQRGNEGKGVRWGSKAIIFNIKLGWDN